VEPFRMRISVEGLVQGFGVRPRVHRLANELKLSGFVLNTSNGVLIEVEGYVLNLQEFEIRLADLLSDNQHLTKVYRSLLSVKGEGGFTIRDSDGDSKITTPFPQDLAVCQHCLAELFSPVNRRFRFPFISCTQCGPRFSICRRLPFDRANTTLSSFPLCSECLNEYSDPADRRFHSQTIGCLDCGPTIWCCHGDGVIRGYGDDAISQVISVIAKGGIVALKGVGGFHLICDAHNDTAVEQLRTRKGRPRKPFALMYPTLSLVREDCQLSKGEEILLVSPQAPVVLLRKRERCSVLESIAPENPFLGVMLPYTPVHHLILRELEIPIVATSGNISGEPICADEPEALEKLRSITDLFLFNDRQIANRCDDSIVQWVLDRTFPIRVARGYAPFTLYPTLVTKTPTLGMGAYLKNSVALGHDNCITVSPHIGDLEYVETLSAQENNVALLCSTYGVDSATRVSDLHPDFTSYNSTDLNQRVNTVQHHYAHALCCLVDNGLKPPCFGVTWDGTGYGIDGTIWGGEGLIIYNNVFERRFHLLPFPLPGGEAAIRDPKRTALGLLYKINEGKTFEHQLWSFYSDRELMQTALDKRINCPECTSVGRLFDGIAALLGGCYESTFEGEAAMWLQYIAGTLDGDDSYRFAIIDDSVIDWRIMVRQILLDIEGGVSQSIVARKFHRTLVNIVVTMAEIVGIPTVMLTGGCFQNSLLLEATVHALRGQGYDPYWHKDTPSNDGGISIGQIIAASV
jgi:hydrogenase maturation protein HypF